MPLSKPPRDATGEVVPHNHEGIMQTDRIIRRVSEEHFVPDPKAATGRRVSSLAFQASTIGNRGMSVDIESSIVEAGIDPTTFVTTPQYIGSVWFHAGYLRSEGFLVGYDPLPENPHHGEVWGNFTKGLRKKLLKVAQWFVEIDNVDLHVAS